MEITSMMGCGLKITFGHDVSFIVIAWVRKKAGE